MRGRLRHMHFRTHPPSALDRWCLVATGAASLFAMLAVAMLALLGKLPLLALWGPGTLLAMPWFVIWLGTRRRLESLWRIFELPISVRTLSQYAVLLVAIALMYQVSGLASGQRGQPMLVVLLFLAQSFGLHTHRADGSAVLTLFASNAACLIVVNELSSLAGMTVFWISAWITGTGLLWVHARATRRRLNYRLRLAPSRDENIGGLWSRALLTAILVPLFLVITSVSTRGVAAAGSWGWTVAGSALHSMGWIDEDPAAARAKATLTPNKGGEGESKPQKKADPKSFPSAPAGFPAELQFQRGLGTPTHQDRLLVADPFAPKGRRRFHAGNPLYLTITTYDRFTSSGVAHSTKQPQLGFTDSGDGREDDWTEVDELKPGMQRIELDLEFQPVLAPGGSRNGRLVLPRLEPLLAVSLPEVQYSSSGMLTFIPDTPGPVRYATRSQMPSVSIKNIGSQDLDLSWRDELSLPDDSRHWQRVLELARAEVERMDLSSGVVYGVQQHFRNNFQYELNVGGAGPASLETLFVERKGYCSFYATAATLCLRILGVPARIGVGYAVTRWDADRRVYVGGVRGGHAWTEVPVRGVGWVPVEVTPSSSLQGASPMSAEAMARLYPGETPQRNIQLGGGENNALAPDGAAGGEEQPADLAVAKPEAEAESKLGLFDNWHFWAIVIASVLGVAVVIGKITNFADLFPFDDGQSSSTDRRQRRSDAFQQLLRLLAKLGYSKKHSQTTLEFTRRVIHNGGEDFDPLWDLTWMRYQEHFGGYPPAPEFEEELEDFTRTVKAMERGQ